MTEPDGRSGILIVDDKPEKLLSLEATLADLGQKIVRAYSGRDALRQLLNEEFAVILLDVNMPGMDGFETAAMIRQRPSSRYTPIIFVTAFGDDMHMARGYSLGAVDYITTPVIPDILRSKVGVLVELYQKTAQIRRQTEILRKQATRLQKLSSASMSINSAKTVDQMLRGVTESAREIIDAHLCAALLRPEANLLTAKAAIHTAAGFSEKHATWRGRELKLDSISATVIGQSSTATRLSESEMREHPDYDAFKRLDLPPIQGGLLAAPLVDRQGKNMGLVFLTEPLAGRFSGEDESLLVQLTQIASIAIQNLIFAREQEANRAKDEFLATLSHELRTPLNAIVGWTRLLRMENLPEEAAHGLEVIDRNVRAQTRLIEDLLDVSRIATGKMRVNLRITHLRPVVQAAVDAVRPAAAARGIELVADLADVLVSGDPDRLQQVVGNLLSNSLKFTPSGGRINVTLDRVNSDAQIHVTDTGKGIEPEFVGFVFDRFRQADSTTTRQHGGLGIGLTIVRHIVRLHGGTVIATSPGIGHGATFTVTLPAAQRTETAGNGHGDPAESRGQPHGIKLSGKRILLVDDEPDARELMSEILRRAEAEVCAVGSVREAFESFSHCTPDVLVSDIALPESDGYSLIHTVRQFPADRGGRTPAIALTAYAREEDRLRALSAGFQMHLSKPVEPHQLVAAIAHLASQPFADSFAGPESLKTTAADIQ